MCHNLQMRHRDTSGRTLTDYPRPSVAVDTAVLTVVPGEGLNVLLVARAGRHGHGMWQLPGTFLHEGETLAQAVHRSLTEKVGVAGLAPVQLRVFDSPDRDDRGWVLSVAHLDVVALGHLGDLPSTARIVPVGQASGLAFDHDAIVELAVERLRQEYSVSPDPRRLLGEEFTLLELERLHSAVAGRRVQKDSFRRGMETRLESTGRMHEGVVGKPARLFRHPEQNDAGRH